MKGIILNSARLTAVVVFVSVAMACNYSGNLSGMHWFLGMHDSHAVEAQEEDYTTLSNTKGDGWERGMDVVEGFGGPGSGIRVPPEGSVPREYQPYQYAVADFAGAGAGLRNPLPETESVVARGQKMYGIYCTPCHGALGHGDGPVTPRFPDIPSVVRPEIQAWRDGEIFHMITVGRGRMRPYAAQIEVNDRWAIIHYMRLLQAKEQTQ